ncbi:hypothetical protein [Brumicola pallidula]|uniref:Uncharacterized protein n=1 Tax=Brumicola pallidula DSM 14239 = ACAM 615 TaxID=1121922 RepID=K6YZQ9_9ALTE|nr:hypothetical protein GPAL_2569 [Glaciecola pallidula DSM 14239 = ACAM 615]
MSSTLILLNNKRQVVNSQPNNGGVNLVDASSLGNPGSFFMLPPITARPTPIVDPGCSTFDGSTILLAASGAGPRGTDVVYRGHDFGEIL